MKKKKNKASNFLKKIMSLLSSIAKAKSLAIKTKTSTFRARIFMLSLMRNKKLLAGSISDKVHILLSHLKNEDSEEDDKEDDNNDDDKAIVLYNAKPNNDEDDDGKYPDLQHSFFEEAFDDPGGSIIDLVKNSKEGGAGFSLEAEIDQVADLFIMRFHNQIRLQKLDSFKRYKEMLERSA